MIGRYLLSRLNERCREEQRELLSLYKFSGLMIGRTEKAKERVVIEISSDSDDADFGEETTPVAKSKAARGQTTSSGR